MTFWECIYCLFTGTDPADYQQRNQSQQQQLQQRSSQTNPISPDPNIFTYRTRDGSEYFQFSYHKIAEKKYEVDIHLFPPFNGRSKNIHTIHVLHSRRSAEHKICIHSGKEPKTLEDAQELSKMYAELINTYIKTGKTPDSQVAQQ